MSTVRPVSMQTEGKFGVQELVVKETGFISLSKGPQSSLKLQAVVSQPRWSLGPKLTSSVRAVHDVLNL